MSTPTINSNKAVVIGIITLWLIVFAPMCIGLLFVNYNPFIAITMPILLATLVVLFLIGAIVFTIDIIDRKAR